MDKILMEGGRRLLGRVKVSGSKNAALPLLAATILADGTTTYRNMPPLRDVNTMINVLSTLGIRSDGKSDVYRMHGSGLNKYEAPYDLVKTMRASILVLGPLLARMGRARVSLPGGCAIGARPIDFHLSALEKMGAQISLEHGYVNAQGRLRGADITFDHPTVTGTENVLMAATLAKGTSVIHNAAQEPEVVDLTNALIKMGAHIQGVGTERIEIEGVENLREITHTIIPDRIEAGTYMIAAGITGGEVIIEGIHPELMQAVMDKLEQAGLVFDVIPEGIRVSKGGSLKSVDLQTAPFPGFPTDMQAQFLALMCIAPGLAVITENVFENRFMHVAELKRMGADVQVVGRNAVVRGVDRISGAPVMATDLRASASLILAGLVAEGTTEISRIYHIDRGYNAIEKKLSHLGAKIERVRD